MLLKIMAVFLVFIAVLAIFGKLRFPGQARLEAARCRNCGRYRIGSSACPCQKGRP